MDAEPEVGWNHWREYLNEKLSKYLTKNAIFDINLSGKFFLLCEILKLSNECGDKLLVFSQSLVVLDLIEEMFRMFVKAQEEKWTVSKQRKKN